MTVKIATIPPISGTTNTIAKFTASTSLGNSTITDTGVLVTISNALSVTGNVTIGDASGDAHSLTGTLSANGAAGSNGQVLAIQAGLPTWLSLSSISGVTGTGTNQKIAMWTSATSIGDSAMTVSGGTSIAFAYTNGVSMISMTTAPVGLSVQTAPTASTLTIQEAFRSESAGSYDTTGGATTVYGAKISAIATRSGGAPSLTNIAIQLDASGAQTNIALQTQSGDVIFNNTAGTTTIRGNITAGALNGDATANTFRGTTTFQKTGANTDTAIKLQNDVQTWQIATRGAGGLNDELIIRDETGAVDVVTIVKSTGATTFVGNVTANGNVTLGDASSDTHTLNGNLTLSNTPTAGPIKYGSLNSRLLVGQQVITASGTYTPSTGTKAVRVRMVGGGGGGGGAGGGAGARTGGGGGSSGVYWEKWIDPAATVTGGAATIGAAGTAGTSGGGTGGNGGDTSVVVQGTTYTAKGGTGNTGLAADGDTNSVAPQTGSTAGFDFVAGSPGMQGVAYNGGSVVIAGFGGSNPFGIGGATPTDSAGQTGQGYGGGGSGGLHNGTTDRAGGAGAAGLIVIEEYA